MSEYARLLQAYEWKSKRNYIVARDRNTCTICNNTKLFEQSIFGRVYHISGLRDTLLVSFKEFKSEKEGQVYMLKKYLDPISCFTPMLVSARVNNLGKLNNYVVAFRKKSKKDWNLFYLRQNLGRTHEDYITAFNTYKEETYNTWEIIGGLEVHHKYYKVGLKPLGVSR